ncbi:prepilin-type N-terminal cleavage/methylation domain-containing protein [Clostridium tyrobutyricum]|uniref:prepilin-type N-terminal cleavage/methylation domain-containing protein n=1 Tax=Clostridium tyrobutyricum TaxID=1519 RepID=UPI00068957AE|nr:prepilin-type N-terminal cleavage/methylation domain-containing protein [Clostridium tyrobutyricum]
MNFIKETLRGNAKKGFTVIEILITISIISIITTVETKAILKYMKLNSMEISSSREKFYIDEAFMIIENQIDSAKYIEIKDNMIALNRYDNRGWDYIKNKNSTLVLSYGYTNYYTNNRILKHISDFKITQMENVCYMQIKTEKGNVYKKCFGIERKKLRKDLY